MYIKSQIEIYVQMSLVPQSSQEISIVDMFANQRSYIHQKRTENKRSNIHPRADRGRQFYSTHEKKKRKEIRRKDVYVCVCMRNMKKNWQLAITFNDL